MNKLKDKALIKLLSNMAGVTVQPPVITPAPIIKAMKDAMLRTDIDVVFCRGGYYVMDGTRWHPVSREAMLTMLLQVLHRYEKSIIEALLSAFEREQGIKYLYPLKVTDTTET